VLGRKVLSNNELGYSLDFQILHLNEVLLFMSTLQEIYQNKLVITLADLRRDAGLLRQIQIRLNALGLYSYDSTDPDGAWGPRTESGLRQFCDAVNLNNFDTGLFGPSFAEALIETTSIQGGTHVPPFPGGTRDDLARAVASEGSAKHGISNRDQWCYIMATIQHETAHTFQPIAEFGGSSAWYAPYYGRGYVQLTHQFNYQAYSTKLGIDFVSAPDRVMEPAISLYIILDGMKNGVFTGVKLDDYIIAGSVDFRRARRIVNDMDRADLIAGYAQDWQSTTLF
jgi:hypothetical protein